MVQGRMSKVQGWKVQRSSGWKSKGPRLEVQGQVWLEVQARGGLLLSNHDCVPSSTATIVGRHTGTKRDYNRQKVCGSAR